MTNGKWLAALIRGDEVPWSAIRAAGLTATGLLDLCSEEDLTSLVYAQLCRRQGAGDWPEEVRGALARVARAEAAGELLRQRAIASALDALARSGIHPVLIKGTALAYSVYDTPSSRPRSDTDLVVRRDEVDVLRRALSGLGYAAPLNSGGELLFCQFAMTTTDALGVRHGFDIHWKISTQSVFADVLTYDELASQAVPLPTLSRDARAAGPVHSLLLACIHPVMHHRNAERLIWVYDTHLLASQLSIAGFDALVELAVKKQMTAVVARGLALARACFDTSIPDGVMRELTASRVPERSAAYLRRDRRWHDELVASVAGLPRWQDRFRLVREVLFPEPGYMLKTYGITAAGASVLLPLLYLHRGMSGAWKVVSGRK